MSVSPLDSTFRSIIECLEKALRRWSKNGTVVEMFDFPVPSRSRLSLTVDSLVFLSIDATLFMMIAFQIYGISELLGFNGNCPNSTWHLEVR